MWTEYDTVVTGIGYEGRFQERTRDNTSGTGPSFESRIQLVPKLMEIYT